MKILIKNTNVITDKFDLTNSYFVSVTGKSIDYIGKTKPCGEFDRVIDGKDKVVMPGLYNTHTHAAMTLFRGYAEDLVLDRWLNEAIFPAEDLLTDESVYVASKLAAAEQIKNGVVSCSDMYFFCENTVRAFGECSLKANISRSVVSFDKDIDLHKDSRFIEAKNLFENYNGAYDGKIKIDMALHAEYTNVEKACRTLAEYSKDKGAIIQVHLSETEKEHKECIERHGKTPARFFLDTGVFDSPTVAAHCVYVAGDDMEIMKEKKVSVAHNPVSNLKLGSGVMPLYKMYKKGINITLGTDGTASNNTLDILKEMYFASMLVKGINRQPDLIEASEFIKFATENGAKAQGRENCGRLEVGANADLIMISLDDINNIPQYNLVNTVLYSANSSNVKLTMIDGDILYENGEFTHIDIEKLKADMKYVCKHYFDKK